MSNKELVAFPFNSLAIEWDNKNYIIIGLACIDNPRQFDPLYIQMILDNNEIRMIPLNKDDAAHNLLSEALMTYLQNERPEHFGIIFRNQS